jgi:hypothetical protein
MLAAAWSGSEFMIVGTSGVTQHSADGISWTVEQLDAGGDLNGVSSLGDRFIAVGSAGEIITTQ